MPRDNLAYADTCSDTTSGNGIYQDTGTESLDSSNTLSDGLYPDWIDIVKTKIFELISLPDNWDSYGAPQIDVKKVKYALRLIDMIMTPDLPLPSIVPTNSGSIQLEWHINGVNLEIIIVSENKIKVYFDSERDPEAESEEELIYDLQPLARFISELKNEYIKL